MRKVIFLIHASLDGYTAGPNGEMDWIVYNDEVEKYSHDLHGSTDAAIYGRVTYEMMAGYWPGVLSDPKAAASERNHAEWVNTATKYVVSRTLTDVSWQGTVIIRENVAEQINTLKQQPGKDMWLLGSPTLAQAFMRHDLIDEYRINVNPVILGGGLPLFGSLGQSIKLNLVGSQMFKGGVMALRYEPQR